MISKEEIKKLADLARIEVAEKELDKLRGEIGAILDYVGQIKSVAGSFDDEIELGENYNIMREDNPPTSGPTEPETWTRDIVAEFPNKEGNYLKVKKIL